MVGRKLIAGVVVTALLLGGVGAAAVMFRPDRAIRVGTGFVAHNLCVKAFVSGLDPQAAFAEIKDRAGIRRMRYLLGYHLDATARTVEVATLGFFGSRAAFHEGQGCIELHGSKQPYLLRSDLQALKVSKAPPLLPEIAASGVVEPADPALKAALDVSSQ